MSHVNGNVVSVMERAILVLYEILLYARLEIGNCH